MDANTPDGRYDRTKPWEPGVSPQPIAPRYQYLGPFASNEERLTQQAIQGAVIPGEDLATLVRPPLPQVNLFPPRFGYGDSSSPGIDQIVNVSRAYTEPRTAWFSGGPAGYSGASRNTLGSV